MLTREHKTSRFSFSIVFLLHVWLNYCGKGFTHKVTRPHETRSLEDLCFLGYALCDVAVRMVHVQAAVYVALSRLDFSPDGRIPPNSGPDPHKDLLSCAA